MTQKGVVPKLRFPEFRKAGDWKTETLGSVAKISTEKVGDKSCVPMSITSGVGLVSQMDKFGRIIAGSSYANYLLLKKYDFAYNKSATKEFPEGFIALYSSDELAAVPNSIFTCFRIKGESPVPQYLNYLFLGNLHGKWLKNFIEVGARAHGSLSIDEDDLLALPIPVPSGKTSVCEQQKIADCLNSLDELMVAQARKVEALKAYKKGLMQQLFPREGETKPKLRFPKFRDAGDWRKTTVGEISNNVIAGGTPSTTEKTFWGGEIRWMNSGELNFKKVYEVQGRITDEGLNNSSTRLIPPRCVLIGLAGQGKTRGTVAMNMVELCTNQSIAAIFPNDSDFNCDFLYHDLDKRYEELRRLSANGEGRGGLNLQIIKSLDITMPSLTEQEHIAAFLTSLDDLIASQTQKLAVLKTHKKGLMQQLFPSSREIEA